MLSWEERIAEFWRDADDADPDRMRIQINQILSVGECSDARGLFERASLEDFLGEESAAVPLYEASLSEGLDVDRENQARLQLASSLRNLGRQHDALRVLNEFELADEYSSARDAFAALALWDKGDGAQALLNALHAADPALGRYRRAIGAYAAELTDDRQP